MKSTVKIYTEKSPYKSLDGVNQVSITVHYCSDTHFYEAESVVSEISARLSKDYLIEVVNHES